MIPIHNTRVFEVSTFYHLATCGLFVLFAPANDHKKGPRNASFAHFYIGNHPQIDSPVPDVIGRGQAVALLLLVSGCYVLTHAEYLQ
jgi:hypothetical protein